MIDLVTLQIVRDFLTIIGAIIAFSYYIMTLRNQNLSRNAQLFLEYHDKINSEPLRTKFENITTWEWKDYKEFEEKYGKLMNRRQLIADSESPLWNLLDVLFFFESLGVLYTKSNLDIEMVGRLASRVIPVWIKYEEVIYEWRRAYTHPEPHTECAWFVEFEDLYLKILEFWRTQTVVTNMVGTFKSRREKLKLPTY